MAKSVRKVLKKRANDFTEKIAKTIRDTDWGLCSETISINTKKLEKTKITIRFEINEDALEEIKQEVMSQRSLGEFSGEKTAEEEASN